MYTDREIEERSCKVWEILKQQEELVISDFIKLIDGNCNKDNVYGMDYRKRLNKVHQLLDMVDSNEKKLIDRINQKVENDTELDVNLTRLVHGFMKLCDIIIEENEVRYEVGEVMEELGFMINP